MPLFEVNRVDPSRFAAEQHRLFTGQRLRIGRSGTVHEVTWVDWINGLTLPAPACHQGWSGLGASGEITPTTHASTCLKCRRLRGLPPSDDADQPALFPL
ncbi:hypothetical protein EWH70_22285 [Amycolatopsis suaedae]|uniref:Uncharacterized protein n=1 Tax=Amycolatopsis suaedae TaxID=2510978 RepID=A0A4Q7J326_9PSEU|nr:hypothetical protein EWH70_22285 [Amycolatopsis suaedae]